jgi:endonuclease YncB( thermonuclease family)
MDTERRVAGLGIAVSLILLSALGGAAQEAVVSVTPTPIVTTTPTAVPTPDATPKKAKAEKKKDQPYSTATPNVRKEEAPADTKDTNNSPDTKNAKKQKAAAEKVAKQDSGTGEMAGAEEQTSTGEKRISGTVASVVDGNTITVADKNKRVYTVVLSGIDAPELAQDFGQKAQEFLAGQVLGKDVEVVGRAGNAECGTRNAESGTKCLVGKVLLNGRDMGLEMVIAGFAWHYNEKATDQSDRDRQVYESAEMQARKLGFNLWSSAKPVPPWEFRSAVGGGQSAVGNQAANNDAAPTASSGNPAKVVKESGQPAAGEVTPAATPAASAPAAPYIGNRRSKIYHWRGCPGYTNIIESNQVPFKTRAEAEAAGYRAAKNCKAGSQ